MTKPRRPHHVYILQDAEFCKIGHAEDPMGRLKQMMVGSPRDLRLAHVFRFENRETAIAVEGEAHRHLSRYRIRGEWFLLSPAAASDGVRVASAGAGHFRFESRGRLDLAHGSMAAASGSPAIDYDLRIARLRFAEEHSGNAGGNGR
ncbi:GIY-YIG nuclease family protein [Mesorhizobium loti]|uniref:GIY-YIG nuclease family protein n=1 Tax=Rhizobium loti TaxID=381 RepID=UPI000D6CF557